MGTSTQSSLPTDTPKDTSNDTSKTEPNSISSLNTLIDTLNGAVTKKLENFATSVNKSKDKATEANIALKTKLENLTKEGEIAMEKLKTRINQLETTNSTDKQKIQTDINSVISNINKIQDLVANDSASQTAVDALNQQLTNIIQQIDTSVPSTVNPMKQPNQITSSGDDSDDEFPNLTKSNNAAMNIAKQSNPLATNKNKNQPQSYRNAAAAAANKNPSYAQGTLSTNNKKIKRGGYISGSHSRKNSRKKLRRHKKSSKRKHYLKKIKLTKRKRKRGGCDTCGCKTKKGGKTFHPLDWHHKK